MTVEEVKKIVEKLTDEGIEILVALQHQPCNCGHPKVLHKNGKSCMEPNHFRDERWCNCEQFVPDDRFRLMKTPYGYHWGY